VNLTAGGDANVFGFRDPRFSPVRFAQLLHLLQTGDNFAKSDVKFVHPRSGSQSDEKLRIVRVRSVSEHRQNAGRIVFQTCLLVGERFAENRQATGTVVIDHIAAAQIDVGHDSVEDLVFVVQTFVNFVFVTTRAQSQKNWRTSTALCPRPIRQ